VKSAARSSASPDATDEAAFLARALSAFDMLGVPRADAIVVACSGGADSAAALLATRSARPHTRIFACYVDHGMRPAASIARDRRAVRAQAKAAGAKAAFVRLSGAPPKGASTEAAMRVGRYRALADFARSVDARFVVTGHQRDDVAESTLMALARGSGIDGIAAMRPRRSIASGIDVVRPLLWASRATLARFVEDAAVGVSIDETNDDVRHRRNAIRKLLSALESSARGSVSAIARSAAIAVEEKALLDAMTTAAWSRCTAPDGKGLLVADLRKLPPSLLRRVLRFEVKRVAGSARDFSYGHCVAIAQAVKDLRGGTFHAGVARAVLSAGRVRVITNRAADEAVDSGAVSIAVPPRAARIAWSGGRIELRMRPATKRRPHVRVARGTLELDGGSLSPGAMLEIRAAAKGDRFVPAGKHAAVSVARFLAKAGLPKDERGSVPLICAKGAVAALVGIRCAAPYAARPGSPVLEVRWTPPRPPHRRSRADD